jgi:hypothetical protein
MSAIATLVLRVSLGALTVGPRADICNVVAGHWRKLMKQVFDAYRPELHYMRGPGPKWHEKHAAAEERGHLAARPTRDRMNVRTVADHLGNSFQAHPRTLSQTGGEISGPRCM